MLFYILRDDLPVAKLAGILHYADYLAYGAHRYKVRAVDANDNFVDSNEITLVSDIRDTVVCDIFHPEDGITLNMRFGEKPARTQAISFTVEENQFDGREYPVFAFTEFAQRKWEFDFSASQESFERLETILERRHPMLLRGKYCKSFIGIVNGIVPTYMPQYVDFTLSLSRCDYNEVVAYD